MKLRSIILVMLISSALGGCSTDLADAPLVGISFPQSTDRELETAMQLVARAPDSALGYNQLAVLYIKRARETGDFNLNLQAESAVQKALAAAPGDVSARRLQASLHLTFHRFAEALEAGSRLVEEFPDDAFGYGVVTDAQAQLGDYPAAVDAAQRMVDLRPNSQSYARVAHLRSLHGDHKGAVEMYKLAARTTDPMDSEAQAWCLAQLGNEFFRHGRYTESETSFDEALGILPGYHLALSGKGRLLASKGDLEKSAEMLNEAAARHPNPDTIILLGDVYAALGDAGMARKQYELVEAGEEKLGEMHDAHRLALFWADHNKRLDESLEIALQDYSEVKDIYAADILAWCLYKKGRLTEARKMINEALRLKTPDARIYYHASLIERDLGNTASAKTHMETAMRLNPAFDIRYALEAKSVLAKLR